MSSGIGRLMALRAAPAFSTHLATTFGSASKCRSNFIDKMHFHRSVKNPNYSGFSSLLHQNSSLLKTAHAGHRSLSSSSNFRIFGINKFEEGGETALMVAVKRHIQGENRLDGCTLLLKAGADPNIPDDSGRTALDHAYAAKDQALIKVLKEAGGKRSESFPTAAEEPLVH